MFDNCRMLAGLNVLAAITPVADLLVSNCRIAGAVTVANLSLLVQFDGGYIGGAFTLGGVGCTGFINNMKVVGVLTVLGGFTANFTY